MAINQKYVQAQVFQLAGAGVSAGDSSMTLTSFNQIDGTPLTMSNFGTIGYGTIEPGSGVNEEQISFTGITSNGDGSKTLTGIKSVGDVFPYTETANLLQGHAGGVSFVISNTAGFYGKFANKINDETITGTWTYTLATRPQLNIDIDAGVPTQFVTFGQLARTAFGDSLVFTNVQYTVTQTAHGFAVGDVLRSSGVNSQFTKSQADTSPNAEVTGVVMTIVDADHFILILEGIVPLTALPMGTVAGDILFLSDITAGALSLVEPTANGTVSKPIAEVLDTFTNTIHFKNYRGFVN